MRNIAGATCCVVEVVGPPFSLAGALSSVCSVVVVQRRRCAQKATLYLCSLHHGNAPVPGGGGVMHPRGGEIVFARDCRNGCVQETVIAIV